MTGRQTTTKPVFWKRLLKGLGCALLIALVGIRIGWVNDHALSYPTVHHAMGDWIELNGAFLYERTSENTVDYSIRLSNAELLSYNEYIELYGEDASKLMPDDGRRDIKSILCLTVDLSNHGEDGQFFIGEAKVLPVGNIKALSLDRKLWMESNKNIDEAQMFLSVYPNTEFTLHIPYIAGDVLYDDGDNRYASALTNNSFSFVVSAAPIRHIIDISL